MHSKNPYHTQKILLHSSLFKKIQYNEIIAPVTVEIDPADGFCNQHCYHCCFKSWENKSHNLIDREKLLVSLKEIKNLGTKAVEFVGGGEPTTHPLISELIQDSINLGFKTGLVTNGLLLSKVFKIVDKLEFLRVSLDCSDANVYSKMHGVSKFHHEIVINNIKKVSLLMTKSQHKKLALGLAYLVVPPFNDSRKLMNDFLDLAISLKVDYIVFRPVSGLTDIKPEAWIKAQKNVLLLREKVLSEKLPISIFGGVGIRWDLLSNQTHPTGMCYSKNMVAVIQANGDIPWCILNRQNKKTTLGNIYTDTFTNIWFSKKHKEKWSNFCVDNCPNICKHYNYNKIIENHLLGDRSKVVRVVVAHPYHI